jgi:Tfp pilus assembly protein PilW
MLKFKKSETGFSLIELLLISGIVLLAATSGLVLFGSGRNTWSSADRGTETIQNAVVGMEKLVREIKNSPGLTAFSDSVIRFRTLREYPEGSGNYIENYAMVGLNDEGNILKYGESTTDSNWSSINDLPDLAWPVTNLSCQVITLAI